MKSLAPCLRLPMLLVLLTCAASVQATEAAAAASPDAAYAAALSALAKGAENEAIDRLELLADQGFHHPDAGLARAAAYLARAEGPRARSGDLGRAAAALTETLLLRPDDPQAERALDAVQAEIAGRRAKQGASVVVRPRLGRAVTSLLPEQVWAIVAGLASFVLAAGLLARRLASSPLGRLSGAVAIGVGGIAALAFGSGAYASLRFRLSTTPAVVVVTEARLLDATGRPLPARRGEDTSAPEGAMVYVLEQTDGRCRVEWGASEGWVERSDLRLFARP